MRKTPTACLLHRSTPWLNGSMDLTNTSGQKISALQNDWRKKERIVDGVRQAILLSDYWQLCRTHEGPQELKYKYKQLWDADLSVSMAKIFKICWFLLSSLRSKIGIIGTSDFIFHLESSEVQTSLKWKEGLLLEFFFHVSAFLHWSCLFYRTLEQEYMGREIFLLR